MTPISSVAGSLTAIEAAFDGVCSLGMCHGRFHGVDVVFDARDCMDMRRIYVHIQNEEYTPAEAVRMSLYIRDNEVDALARQVQRATEAPNKTEAVRAALLHELERAGRGAP